MILYIHKKVPKRLLKKAKSDILSDIFLSNILSIQKTALYLHSHLRKPYLFKRKVFR